MDGNARPGWATYRDRTQAGQRLADGVARLRLRRPLVLALPRGGVPVARAVADAIGAPLDLLLVRKIGAPGHRELGLGAIGEDGVEVLDHERIRQLGIPHADIDRIVAEERGELERRAAQYHVERATRDLTRHDVVIVDDGIATGGTVAAAVEVVRHRGARRVVVAVPVGSDRSLAVVHGLVDHLVCPVAVPGAFAVGSWYRDFHQLDDAEVVALLDPVG